VSYRFIQNLVNTWGFIWFKVFNFMGDVQTGYWGEISGVGFETVFEILY
jgi:hypothetical protein